MTPAVEHREHHRRLLVAFVAAVLAFVVGIALVVDAPASTPSAKVPGSRVAAHHHPAAAVVTASEDVRAGEGRAATTEAAKEVVGSRVVPQAIGPAGNPSASPAWAREGLALPPGNDASLIQQVLVPAGTRIQRSRALGAFGTRGGGEQFELLERIPSSYFGPRMPWGQL